MVVVREVDIYVVKFGCCLVVDWEVEVLDFEFVIVVCVEIDDFVYVVVCGVGCIDWVFVGVEDLVLKDLLVVWCFCGEVMKLF